MSCCSSVRRSGRLEREKTASWPVLEPDESANSNGSCHAGLSRRRRMDSGMRWLLSSATSPSMASSNADRVVMAAVPGFGFPVDAPNVATPRGLRDGKKTRTKRQMIKSMYSSTCPLVACQWTRMTRHERENQGETRHNGCQTTRLNTQNAAIQKGDAVVGSHNSGYTDTQFTHTIKINKYERKGRHAT